MTHGVVFKRVSGRTRDLPRAYFRELVAGGGLRAHRDYRRTRYDRSEARPGVLSLWRVLGHASVNRYAQLTERSASAGPLSGAPAPACVHGILRRASPRMSRTPLLALFTTRFPRFLAVASLALVAFVATPSSGGPPVTPVRRAARRRRRS